MPIAFTVLFSALVGLRRKSITDSSIEASLQVWCVNYWLQLVSLVHLPPNHCMLRDINTSSCLLFLCYLLSHMQTCVKILKFKSLKF
jgi:hypothetical protein